MKKLLLLSISVGLAFGAFAQSASNVNPMKELGLTAKKNAVAKTTVVMHDSLIMSNFGPADTLAYTYSLPNDSGIITGTNALGFTACAERYTFNAVDSTVQVLGVAAIFIGTVNSASTKVASIKVWNAASRTASSRPTLFFTGAPTAVLDSVNVSYTALGISPSTATLKAFYFGTPTAYLADTFFVGFSTNYTWTSMGGDTIGLASTLNGNRTSPIYTIAGTDTTVNNQNVAYNPLTNAWYDYGFNFGFKSNFWVFPIVNTKVIPVGFKGITRNDFTFFGNYPNPATNNTNIKFAIANSTSVTIQVTDISGRVVSTINQNNLAAGEHIATIETANLAAGEYLYVIHTTEGDGIAGKFTVAK